MGNGFYAYHANHLEDLREVVVKVCKTAPLAPLSPDMFLVQSNGIAQWLKLALAKDENKGGLGISANLEFSLPSSFIWRAYRSILSTEDVPETSPLDKSSLAWRLYRLLPDLQKQSSSSYASLLAFLAGDKPALRLYQLAQRLADLYDQYQVYRADWLRLWKQGQNKIHTGKGLIDLPDEQTWQATLWRLILDDVGTEQANTSRASIHERFKEHAKLNKPANNLALLPQRIFVFGISSLSRQTLEALHIVSQYTQVVFCVVNPCQYYWADIVSERELLLSERKRGKLNNKIANINIDNMHQHANPLLASLGKQGRDYIRLLDEFDETSEASSQEFANISQIDIYRPYGSDAQNTKEGKQDWHCTLLSSIQNDIFNLTPIKDIAKDNRALRSDAKSSQENSTRENHSIAFHQVYSPQREIEVLHDQLLHAFQQDPNLQASDIIVMMPDVNTYAPFIKGVFGLYDYDDKRHIPFTISDQGLKQQAPLLVAFESLLSCNTMRFTYSEVMALLELPSIHEQFGIKASDLEQLKTWIKGVNIRWGLSADARKEVTNGQLVRGSTWLDGLKSMLLGYAMSRDKIWADTQAYSEIGGLQASLLGPLVDFIDALQGLSVALKQDKPFAQWQSLVSALLRTFFKELEPNIQSLKNNILDQVDSLSKDISLAQADDIALPLSAFKESLFNKLDNSTVNHKFMLGKVNFATLMPMRAIPFKRVYLLGMNNGDYPRTKINNDFDLMAKDYRPGDRSVRDDDRYLFLEAILSAQEFLYISWIGRSIKDDSHRPPSVLLAQLQDYIDKYWQPPPHKNGAKTSVEWLTTLHPLQAFSRDYYNSEKPHLFSYSTEWEHTLKTINSQTNNHASNNEALQAHSLRPQMVDSIPQQTIGFNELVAFLKHPLRYFYNQTLSVYFEALEIQDNDNENFDMGPLSESILIRELVDSIIENISELKRSSPISIERAMEIALQKSANKGDFGLENTPLIIKKSMLEKMNAIVQQYLAICQRYPIRAELQLNLEYQYIENESKNALKVEFQDTLDKFYTNQSGELARIHIASSKTLRSHSSKGVQARHENLIQYYVEHLIGHLAEQPFCTYVIGHEHEQVFKFEPITQAPDLDSIFEVFTRGSYQALPLHPSVSFAYLFTKDKTNKDPIVEAQTVLDKILEYDKGYLRRTCANAEPFCRRPEFEKLSEHAYMKIYQGIEDALLAGGSNE